MKKISILFAVVVPLMTGCGLWPYIGPGETPVDRLERQCRDLQAEVVDITKENRDSQADFRKEYAEVKAVLAGLRSEVQSLRGELEQANYALGQHINASGQWRQSRDNASPVSGQTDPSGPTAAASASPLPPAMTDNRPVGKNSAAVQTEAMDEDYLYVTGRQLFDAGDYAGARKIFERFLKRFPESQQSDNAYFWIGEAYFREKEYAKAILKYQEVIDKFPNGNKVPAAFLKQGLAFNRIKDDINARLVLKRLISRFPDSREAKDAGKLLQEM